MYYLNKIVGYVISPLGIAMLAAIIALLCGWGSHIRLARAVAVLAALWLWFWMTPIATFLIGTQLEREFLVDGRVPNIETYQETEAIVLLGGGMGGDTNLSSYAEMSAGADRVWQAARLFKAGKAAKIISTGVDAKNSTMPLLKDFEIAEDCVVFLDAKNTEEEAKSVAQLGLRRILLVTSAWHMKRARLMFEKYAPKVEVICAPTDFEQTLYAAKVFSTMAVIPDVNGFLANSVAFHEWLGILCYSFFK
ncbi:MAG: YdcF family protein [Kiritimatiellae bacterium]|nr:YdcF family protein [Kiritimatiellia bacterium]